jgi:heptosyltransferase-1
VPSASPRRSPGAIVAPPLGLRELAALLGAGQTIAIGVDTGLAHLATALRVPTIALYVARPIRH